jgi:hypothetical protein
MIAAMSESNDSRIEAEDRAADRSQYAGAVNDTDWIVKIN